MQRIPTLRCESSSGNNAGPIEDDMFKWAGMIIGARRRNIHFKN